MRLLSIILLSLVALVYCEDYYELLGIGRDADDRTIRKAFKKLAIKMHPDKNKDDPDAHDAFVKINKAYEVLKDENLRKKYDQYGEKGLEDGFNGGNNYQSWQFYNDNFGIYDDDAEIVTLNRAEFQRQVTDTNQIWFINFYSTYCSHCHELAPTWRQFARAVEGAVRVGAVNCAEDPMLCQGQRVGSYPSLVVYPSGEFYNSVRDVEMLVEFIMQRLKSEVLHLNSENIRSLSQDWEPYNTRPWIIDFCESGHDCLSSNNRRKLAAMLDGLVNIGTVDCAAEEALCSKFEIPLTGPSFFPAGKISPENMLNLESIDPQELSKMVIKHLEPFPKMNQEQFEQIQENGVEESVVVWLLGNENQLVEHADMRRLSALVDNEIFTFDCSSSAKCENIVDMSKLPQFVVFKSSGGYEIDYEISRDYHKAAVFIREASDSSLFALDRETYADAISGQQPFIVDYFAPWCPPCLKLLSEYRRIRSDLPQDHPLNEIRIGSIDCQKYKDLCTSANVNSYPTSVLYTTDGKQHRMVGFHSSDGVIEFIDNALHPAVVELTPEDFVEKVQGRAEEESWIVDFFAPWCGPCQQLAPELQRAARALIDYDENVHVASVDCQQFANFCKQQLVAAYPTIRLFPSAKAKQLRQAKHYDYPNHMWRNSDSIQRWVYGMLPSNVVSLGNDFWTTVLDSDQPWVVDFYAPWCGHCVQFAPTYDQIAKAMNEKVNFAKVDCDQWPGVCQGAQVRAYPTVRLYKGRTSSQRQDIWGMQIQTQQKDGFIDVLRQVLGLSSGHDEL